MTEQWFCLTCEYIGELDTHARCSCCQSDAVVSVEASYKRMGKEERAAA